MLLQGPVILSEKSVLPGVQKARERHCFLFETALLICKRNENKCYSARISTPISKLQWEAGLETFTIWGNGNRVCLKPVERPSAAEWKDKLNQLSREKRLVSSVSSSSAATSGLNGNSSIPPPMAIFRSLPRPTKKFQNSEGEFNVNAKASLEV